ncbi:MAG: hypothetical protein EB068_01450, partial [Betaproteobacteria bacterium]|nr:hypothetical protein [Betaproteobacteria bacterium]
SSFRLRAAAGTARPAVSVGMLVEGRHYFPECDPQSLGHKVLAVNLSDLAAMGARPLGFTLSMGLRAPREAWLTSFSEGLYELASDTGCALLGGDTVAVPSEAPEVFSVSVLGTVPLGRALRRDGVCPGDQIWVSGHGDLSGERVCGPRRGPVALA